MIIEISDTILYFVSKFDINDQLRMQSIIDQILAINKEQEKSKQFFVIHNYNYDCDNIDINSHCSKLIEKLIERDIIIPYKAITRQFDALGRYYVHNINDTSSFEITHFVFGPNIDSCHSFNDATKRIIQMSLEFASYKHTNSSIYHQIDNILNNMIAQYLNVNNKQKCNYNLKLLQHVNCIDPLQTKLLIKYVLDPKICSGTQLVAQELQFTNIMINIMSNVLLYMMQMIQWTTEFVILIVFPWIKYILYHIFQLITQILSLIIPWIKQLLLDTVEYVRMVDFEQFGVSYLKPFFVGIFEWIVFLAYTIFVAPFVYIRELLSIVANHIVKLMEALLYIATIIAMLAIFVYGPFKVLLHS